jgi:ABC-type nitrate/sulfonate/bicarbonate transport system substrate-binding protein
MLTILPNLRSSALAAMILMLAPIGLAAAQTKITIGVPPVPEFVLPMIAVEKGYFRGNTASMQPSGSYRAVNRCQRRFSPTRCKSRL